MNNLDGLNSSTLRKTQSQKPTASQLVGGGGCPSTDFYFENLQRAIAHPRH